MKDRNNQILLTTLLGSLMFVAGYFTYNGLSNDFIDGKGFFTDNLSGQNDREICVSALDTTKYFEEPCYEFTHYEKSPGERGKISDSLSKTIVKVTNDGKKYQPLEGHHIKDIPANASLNIMLETYTVSRLSDTCDQYIVTIESFSTKMEKTDRDMTYLKPSASLSKSDILKLKRYLGMSGNSSNTSLVKLEDGKYIYQ